MSATPSAYANFEQAYEPTAARLAGRRVSVGGGARTCAIVVSTLDNRPVSDIALYHPYVNFHDEAWLKGAALYWPKLGRIRPVSYYRSADSETVRRLNDELGLIVNVDPGWEPGWSGSSAERGERTEDAVELLFFAFLQRHRAELVARYGMAPLGIEPLPDRHISDRLLELDPRLDQVHAGKMGDRLANQLADDGLLQRLHYDWLRPSDGKLLRVVELGMHRRLAHAYLAVLADVIARQNGMATVTDQPLSLVAMSGWTVDTLGAVLLGDEPQAPVDQPPDEAFATVALRTVVPRDLAEIPVSRIIEARRRLLPELIAYRRYLDSLVPVFLELAAVRDPEVRAAKFELAVETEVTHRLEAIERELGRLGMVPVRAVLSVQTLAPPAAIAVLTETFGLSPVLTGTGVVAGSIAGAATTALAARETLRQAHPAGYLLGLKRELGPSDTVAAVRAAFRKASSGRLRRG